MIRLLCSLVLLTASASSSLADASKGIHAECPNGPGTTIYWLYVLSADGTCDETSKHVYECWDRNSRAMVDCDSGCEGYENKAGCQLKTRTSDANLTRPNLDVQCPTGHTYRVTDDREGASCERSVDSGVTTGGQCGVGNINSTEFRCSTGCEFERSGASCQCLTCR